MSSQAHPADRVALAVEILSQPAHFLGRAGEAVCDQAAGLGVHTLAWEEERFSSWDDLGHGLIITS